MFGLTNCSRDRQGFGIWLVCTFQVSTWKRTLDFEWLVNYSSKQQPPSPLAPAPFAFHASHPNEKFPDSQITRASWAGKEGNQLRLKTSLAAVTTGRNRLPGCSLRGKWRDHTVTRQPFDVSTQEQPERPQELTEQQYCQESPLLSTWPSHAQLFSPRGLWDLMLAWQAHRVMSLVYPPFHPPPLSPSSTQRCHSPPAFRPSWGNSAAKYSCWIKAQQNQNTKVKYPLRQHTHDVSQ